MGQTSLKMVQKAWMLALDIAHGLEREVLHREFPMALGSDVPSQIDQLVLIIHIHGGA